ncbi:hypothetical protein Tsubulata_014810 [Turnera subulata]|uniref:F-box/LRR-repeat protein 15-like leucin rich repeat domain-containing protein n=1 Tax=Turnera subulata TaxID=218843 RepID=A0A9Q0FYE0_9ROSI|nr:hypothetical protein Tsubulata_014810 [Turnera subulata]
MGEGEGAAPTPSCDLPQECWELIFNSLGHHSHLESLSLVSTRFLSITNHLRLSLILTPQTLPSLPRLLRRFPNLKHIEFPELAGTLDSPLRHLSQSGLDLDSLAFPNQTHFPFLGLAQLGQLIRNLRKLNCSKIHSLQDSHLDLIASSFPLLEDLDISFPQYTSPINPDGSLGLEFFPQRVTDDGIIHLSMNLNKLLKINLSGNHFISDKSLLYLSANCVLLREVVICDCDFITQNGIALAMRKCENLNCITLLGIGIPSIDSVFQGAFSYAKNLCDLNISHSFISDELLYSVAEAPLPLKRLGISRCYNVTSAGVFFLLYKHQFLEYLDLEGANFLTDDCMIRLSKFLSCLVTVNLNLCSRLTGLSFFSLLRSCPLLRDVQMERTNLGVEEEFDAVSVRNYRLKALNLAGNESLSDECIDKIASSCPNLQVLKISHCPNITEEGIQNVFGHCRQIRHLEMNYCRGIGELDMQIDYPNLEVLLVKGQGIEDEALRIIAKRCPALLQLDLEGCVSVTKEGLNEVVQNCWRLREINLKWCQNLKLDAISLLVFSRPSLRKIVPPGVCTVTDNQRNFFLRHGCLVCKD